MEIGEQSNHGLHIRIEKVNVQIYIFLIKNECLPLTTILSLQFTSENTQISVINKKGIECSRQAEKCECDAHLSSSFWKHLVHPVPVDTSHLLWFKCGCLLESN